MAEIDDLQPERESESIVPLEERLTINLDEEDDDAPESPEENRKGRRARERALKAELSESREKMAAMEARLNEFSSRPQHPVYLPQQQQQADPVEDYLNGLDAQKQTILQALANPNLGDGQDRELRQQWNKLDAERIRIIARQSAPASAPPMTQEQMDSHLLASQYPEIYSDPALKMEAQAEMAKLVQRQRKPVSIVTAREALDRVKERNGIGQRKPAPTDSQRSRHMSTPGSAGVGGSSGTQFTPSRAELRLALEYCNTPKRRDLSDQQKVKIWAKECK